MSPRRAYLGLLFASTAWAGPRESILAASSDATVALCLVFLGVVLIYIEFIRPGWVLPGVLGGVVFCIGASAISAHPINPIGPTLLLLSALLLATHARQKLHAAWGAAAALLLVASLALFIKGPEHLPWSRSALFGIAITAITFLLGTKAAQARRNKTKQVRAQ